MIFANSVWGGWLADASNRRHLPLAGLGPREDGDRSRPHEGIGVEHYAWCTSPLRRYVDLVNQRQLLACVRAAAAAVRIERRRTVCHRFGI